MNKKKKYSSALKVGILTLTAISILIFTVLWVKGRSLSGGERIDIEIMKSRALIPYDTLHVKVLARGTINKPLYVFANDFSLCAIKMLLLSGGKAIRQKTKSVGFSFGKKTKRKPKRKS